jgi:hypothetical protein
MRSHVTTSLAAALVLAGAVLAACSGGGTGASPHAAIPSATATPTTGGNDLSGPTAKIVLTIPRRAAHTVTGHAKGHHVLAARRKPRYLSPDTNGIQVTVTGNGTSKTVYADASTNSSLCTNAGSEWKRAPLRCPSSLRPRR